MLTPRFELTQNDTELIVRVYAPYANIKDTEVYVDGNDLRFYSSPYYLRLKLPGEIEENDKSSGSYDCDDGIFTLNFSKTHPGQYFDNLDMITTLLSPPREKKNILPNIEVIRNPAVADENPLTDDGEVNGGNEWFLPQSTSTSNGSAINLLTSPKYGFANKISGALASFEEGWLKDVVDLPNPDTTPMADRCKLREANEKQHFSDDHYMADLMQPDTTTASMINFIPSFYSVKPNDITFNEREMDVLKEMPNKEYLLSDEEMKIALLGLVDILYGACYNNRVTLGENTSESCWDINKISSTLSWFDYFSSVNDVVRACLRRSLCYPLVRQWDLSLKVLEDVKVVLKNGKKSIVQRLCDIYGLFNNSYEPRYLLNQLYIKDYIIWAQKMPESMLNGMINDLDAVKIDKKDVDLDIVELEAAAWSVIDEETDDNSFIEVNVNTCSDQCKNVPSYERFVAGIGRLQLKDNIDDDSTSSDSDESSSLTSSSCSSSSSSSSESSTTVSSSSSSGSDLIRDDESVDSDDTVDDDN